MLDPITAAMLVSLHQQQMLADAEQARQVAQLRRVRSRSAALRQVLRRRSGAAGRAASVTTG